MVARVFVESQEIASCYVNACQIPSCHWNEFNISGVTLIRNEVCLINGILPFSRHARLFSSVSCILYSQVFFSVHLLTCFLQQPSSCVSTFHADVKYLPIEYSLFDSSRTGTIYGNPHSRFFFHYISLIRHQRRGRKVKRKFNRCCCYTKGVTITRPTKRNSRLSQHLLQGCMAWLNCIHTNYLFSTSSPTSYMMATSNAYIPIKCLPIALRPTTHSGLELSKNPLLAESYVIRVWSNCEGKEFNLLSRLWA